MRSIEENKMILDFKKRLVAALYEAKVKDDEIITLLLKYGYMDEDEALMLLRNEKIVEAPCRNLYQYLILNKYTDEKEADKFIHNKARSALSNNMELSKLSPAKLYDEIKGCTN